MGHELDSTLNSFRSYAELTQTQAWAKQSSHVRADTQDADKAVEISHGSRYAEGPVLGVGGMGKVVLARDERIGRDVAVKVLHPEGELEPHERVRFLREAQVQGQLEHPSIVPVYDIDRRADGTTFFTMRRVLGRTLHAILDDLRNGVPAAKQRYTQRELLTAFATVCLTIDYAHSRGVVHRDLKPANIMLGDFGEVYVLDWGLARFVDEQGDSLDEPQERLSMPGSLLGTPMYMAPEQMADPDVGAQADVYSLGEWVGALPASYVFENGTWTIVPQLVELPKLGTYVFLTAANVGMIVIPCLFIAKLREELTRAQLSLATQAWQFKQLGAQLIGRPDTAPGR